MIHYMDSDWKVDAQIGGGVVEVCVSVCVGGGGGEGGRRLRMRKGEA